MNQRSVRNIIIFIPDILKTVTKINIVGITYLNIPYAEATEFGSVFYIILCDKE